ncbi:MAG: terminase small subunit [Thiohalorhabdus sp.]
MGKRVNRNELAEIFGVSPPTISTWINQGCPYLQQGRKGRQWEFDTEAVAEWRQSKALQAAQGDLEDTDYEEAKRREMVARANMQELDLAQRRGELVPVEDVARTVGDEYARAKARLRAVPSSVAAVVPAEVRTVVQERVSEGIDQALEELVSYGGDADYSDSDGGAGEREPAEDGA